MANSKENKRLEGEIANQTWLMSGLIPGVRLFRNNVGEARAQSGQWIKFGLHKGSSDFIGWQSLIVTSEMIGKRIAVFIGVEIKTPEGVVSPEQQGFLEEVNRWGGKAVVITSASELKTRLAQQL